MSTPWIIAFVAQSVVLLTLGFVVLTVMRQIGVLTLEVRGKLAGGTGPRVGSRAPAFRGRDIRSSHELTSTWRGRRTMLIFLSNQCSMCATLVPHVNRFAAEAETRITTLAHIGEDYAAAADFVRRHKLAVPALSEADTQAFSLYGVQLTPTVVVVGADGIITASGSANSYEDLLAFVADAREPVIGHELARPVDADADLAPAQRNGSPAVPAG